MNSPGISVERERSDHIIRYLLKNDLIRKDLKIKPAGNRVQIPLKRPVRVMDYTPQEMDFDPRVSQNSDSSESDGSGMFNSSGSFPKRWIRLGDAIIIKKEYLGSHHIPYEIIARRTGARSIYVDSGRIWGDVRKPSIKLVFGSPGPVIHIENGIRYRLDPMSVMFSPGNVNERIRQGRLILQDATVIDMFAGIGYFSLQLAKYTGLSRIYAAEINPDSFQFLRDNISMNRLSNRISAFNGDCRTVLPDVVADYIIMGHFRSREYLTSALSHSHRGTILNMHLLVSTERIDDHWMDISQMAVKLGYRLDFLRQRIVKSFAPHLWHISLDMTVLKTVGE